MVVRGKAFLCLSLSDESMFCKNQCAETCRDEKLFHPLAIKRQHPSLQNMKPFNTSKSKVGTTIALHPKHSRNYTFNSIPEWNGQKQTKICVCH